MPRSVRHDGHIQTAATEAAEMAAGRTALVVAAEPIGITTYDADGDHRRRRCPRGAATADVMMTMACEKRGKATGDYKATTRQWRGNKEGNQLWRCRWQGQGGNRQEDNKYYFITNQTFAPIFFASFPHDTKVTSATNEMAIRTQS